MKSSIISVITQFNTNRMLKDYMDKMYRPTAENHILIQKDNYKKAIQFAEWRKSIRTRFPSIHIKNISIQGIEGDILNVGDEIQVYIAVNRGKVNKREIKAEVLFSQDKSEESITYSASKELTCGDIQYVAMELIEEQGELLKYRATYTAQKSGKFNYGIRILPYHHEITDLKDLNLVFWG